MGAKMDMPSREGALKGRDTEMKIENKHFVLGNPIKGPFGENLEVAVFGTGCFWGTEKGFWRLPGVYSTAVGYSAGFTPNPTYNEVCSGQTGHNEVVQVVYDQSKISYSDLLRLFWESHDPTQYMGQGNDKGTQYRSGIYYYGDDQKSLAEASKAAYDAALKKESKGEGKDGVVTEIVEGSKFYFAEDYHQQYLAKPGNRQYCSAMPTSCSLPPFDTWSPDHLKSKYASVLPEDFWNRHGPKPGCTIKGPNAQLSWP